MDLNKRHRDWEDETPELNAIHKKNPFKVPEGYFEDLENEIYSKIRLAESSISSETGFTVPDDYFQALTDKMNASITLEELKKNTANLSVPAGYFDQLTQQILDKTTGAKEAKVRSLTPRWFRYAAAASVAVISGVWIFSQNQNNIDHKLSRVPDQEIVTYLETYADQMDTQIIVDNLESPEVFTDVSSNISEQDLKQYLEETTL